MGFNWGGVVGQLTGGLYNPSTKKEKMPDLPDEEEYSLQKVDATKQAGGGQVKYTEEKMMPVKAGGLRASINPSSKEPAKKLGSGFNKAFSKTGGTAATTTKSPLKSTGTRSEAAASMMNESPFRNKSSSR